MKNILIFLLVVASAPILQAKEIRYEISTQTPVSRMIQFSIPYTMGVHEGSAEALHGGAVTDENDNVIGARFQVPIDSIRTGNKERDCHLREALGINYSQSRFPKEHVCDSKNELPLSGPDSVQYPEIVVDFQGMSLPSEPFTIGTPKQFEVKVKIAIHGVEKIQLWPVMITKIVDSNGVQGFHLMSQFTESLKDFGIQVKPFALGPIKIGVKDQVTVRVALDLVQR